MILLTDLSEVLIKGIYGVEQIFDKRYGSDASHAFTRRHLEVEEIAFRNLMRGRMTEDAYWKNFAKGCREWHFCVDDLENAISQNIKKTVPGTLDVYKRITSYPDRLPPSRNIIDGRPEIYLVSDHIKERIEELHGYHPEVFEIISREFWSCESGKLKADDGFFEQLMRVIDVSLKEVIFIDDSEYNTTAASLAGITSIRFTNAEQLESALNEYGFGFAPKNN